ncbi:hypothetical protein BC829DRAFT_403166 [Chytridium lagenaria]|nr:hypothetical protein BC829DRAFT_403166 [Chytridium lagenaria]
MDIQRLRSSLRTLQTIHLDLQARLVARFCHDDEDIGSNEAIMRSLEKYAKKVASLVEKAVVRTQTTEGLRCYAKPPSLRPAALESMDTLRGSLAMGLDIASAITMLPLNQAPREMISDMEFVAEVRDYLRKMKEREEEEEKAQDAVRDIKMADTPLAPNEASLKTVSDAEFLAEVVEYLRKMREQEEEDEKTKNAVELVAVDRGEEDVVDVDALFAALDNDDTNVLMVSERNDLAIKKSPKKQKVRRGRRRRARGGCEFIALLAFCFFDVCGFVERAH